jgi:hypothetical protein
MIVTIDQLHRGIMTYAEEEIAAKANGVAKFAAYFLISSLYDHPEKTVGALLNNPFIGMTDLVNEDGTIKGDELYKAARTAMEKARSITISGITFSIPDVDKLYSILQRS